MTPTTSAKKEHYPKSTGSTLKDKTGSKSRRGSSKSTRPSMGSTTSWTLCLQSKSMNTWRATTFTSRERKKSSGNWLPLWTRRIRTTRSKMRRSSTLRRPLLLSEMTRLSLKSRKRTWPSRSKSGRAGQTTWSKRETSCSSKWWSPKDRTNSWKWLSIDFRHSLRTLCHQS